MVMTLKKLFLFTAIALMISSCATQRRCLEKFGKSDTIRVTNTVYRDTVINVIIQKLPPKLTTGSINTKLSIKYGTVNTEVWVKNDTIFVFSTSVDTTLQVRLDSVIKVINDKEMIIRTMEKKYIPKWIRELAMFGGLVLLLFISVFLFKVIRHFQID
jgi:hypothetical protein